MASSILECEAVSSRDPLDGVPGTTAETNPYHYVLNDPINMTDPSGLRPSDCDGFGDSQIKKCKTVVNDISGSIGQTAAPNVNDVELAPPFYGDCYGDHTDLYVDSVRFVASSIGLDPKMLYGLLLQKASDCKGITSKEHVAKTPLTDLAGMGAGLTDSVGAFNIDPKLFAFALQSRGKDATYGELRATITNPLIASAATGWIVKDLLQVIHEVEQERPDFAGEISVNDLPR